MLNEIQLIDDNDEDVFEQISKHEIEQGITPIRTIDANLLN